MDKPEVNFSDGSAVFTVKVVPGSSRTACAGLMDGMIRVKVSAPPEKGKANKQLLKFFSERLGKRRNEIEIVSGHTGPVKQLRVRADSAGEAEEKLLRRVILADYNLEGRKPPR